MLRMLVACDLMLLLVCGVYVTARMKSRLPTLVFLLSMAYAMALTFQTAAVFTNAMKGIPRSPGLSVSAFGLTIAALWAITVTVMALRQRP